MLLRGCANVGEASLALVLYDEMQRQYVPAISVCCGAMCQAYTLLPKALPHVSCH